MGSALANRHGATGAAALGFLTAGMLLVTSVLTLGPPDLTSAGQFLAGSYPSMTSAVAFLSLVCYTVVLGAVGLAVIGGLRMATRGRSGGRTTRAIALILAGAVLLSLSVVNRVDSGGGICCGGGPQQVREAVSLAR